VATVGKENRTVRNGKPDHPVSPKATTVPSCQHEQGAPKDGSSADRSRSSQGQTGPKSETSANDEVKPDTEKGLEEVAAE
jgi:hypothetical protein